MEITFGFSRPKKFGILSWLIMSSTRAPYSHSYVKLYSEKYDRWMIYQASSTMVNFMNMETFDNHSKIVKEIDIPITEELKTNIMKFAIDHCGQPYGIKELFGLGIVLLAGMVGQKIKNPFSNKATWVCSGLSSEIIKEFLSDLIPLDVDPDDMNPKDVYDLLIAYINRNI